jgi:probable rRNA maturation factor
VTVSDEWGRRLLTAAGLGLDRWLAAAAPERAVGAVHVALISDARARALNRRYRQGDYPTDVLSFPSRDPEKRQTVNASPFLGEIVIARGVARRQAREAGHSDRTEIRVLALHGLLHLLGYDHERDSGTMARLERRLRAKGGLPGGLLERHPVAGRRGAGTP